jgi:hypothetical protein
MYTLLIPELMQLDIGTSIKRYAPPIGTAGFERVFVNGYKREPAPPPKMMAATDFVFDIADIVWFSFGCCAMASERVIVFWILLPLLVEDFFPRVVKLVPPVVNALAFAVAKEADMIF